MIKRSYRAHPVMMLSIMKPFLFVLVLPVIKGAVQYLVTQKISGVLSLEMVLVAALGVISYLGCRAFKITVDDERIVINQGFIIRRVTVIRRERIASVTSGIEPLDVIFRSVTYKINTEAGASGKTDFSFKLSARDSEELFFLLFGDENRTTVRFPVFKTAVFSAAASSAVTGLVVAVPVINNLGKLLGVAISKMIFDGINRAASGFNKYFPPAVNVITGILIAGYLASFVIIFLGMLRFRLKVGKEKIEVKSGVIIRKHTVFKKTAVNNICIEQTPILCAARMYCVRAAVGGYGNKKGEKAIIVPAEKHQTAQSQIEALFPKLYTRKKVTVPARSKAMLARFLWPAELYAALDIGGTALLAALFPEAFGFFVLLGAALMAVIVYLGFLAVRNYKTGGITIGKQMAVYGISGRKTCELYCESARVGEIKIIETPADARLNTCKVEIIIRSESADKLRALHLNKSEVLSQIEKEFKIYE